MPIIITEECRAFVRRIISSFKEVFNRTKKINGSERRVLAIELIVEDKLDGYFYRIKVQGKNELEIDRRENAWKARELYQAMVEGELEKPVDFDEITVENIFFYYLHFIGDEAKKHVQFLLDYFNEEQLTESYIWNNDTKYAAIVIPNYHFETTKVLSVLNELELIKAKAENKEETQAFINVLKFEAINIPELYEYIESNHKWLLFKKRIKNFFNELKEIKNMYHFYTDDEKDNTLSKEEKEKKKVDKILKRED